MSQGRAALTRLGLMLALVVFGVFLMCGTVNAQQQWLMILGADGIEGQRDPYTEFSLDEGQTWQPAYLSGYHLWGMIPGTTSFLNCGPSQYDCLNRSVLYRVRFTIPDDASNLELRQFIMIADNYADIWLNGTLIGQGEGRFYPPNRLGTDALRTGLNEVLINLTDFGGSAGMSFRIDITVDGPTPPTVVPADTVPPTISGAPDRAPNSNGWYNADVIVTFACNDTGGSGLASCTEATTLAEGAGQSVTGTAVDKAGNTASATVSGINIDKTNPVVTFSGNQGIYAVNETVQITCTSTDSLSGMAGGTCADISVPAYSLALGTNTVSAEATDKAGNTGTAFVSFTVVVSNDSLCSLTDQFVTKSGVANSLCAKLTNAAKQAAAGKRAASNQMLQAYINELAAQSGKALAADQAGTLTRLARGLMR